MRLEVEIEERDGLARAGRAYFGSIEVEIPHLLVVVDPDPSRQLVPLDIIKKMGIKVIMTSSYIARKKVGQVNLKDHLNWEYVLYTDSGTYQAYSQGVEVDPLESVRYQLSANVDVLTPVDEFTLPSDSRDTALRKALKSLERWKVASELARDKVVSAPIQGGSFMAVRSMITEKYVKLGAKLLAIGGIVPLLINYEFDELVNVVMPTINSRPWGALVHAFGAGHPVAFPLLVFMGVDLFDSAMYSIAAKDLRLLTSFGTLRVEEVSKLRDFPEECEYCPSITPRELNDLERNELLRFIATYNLNSAVKRVREIRERILYGTFQKWALAVAHSHPRLTDGFIELHAKWRETLSSTQRAFPKTRVPIYPILRDYVDRVPSDLIDEFNYNLKGAYGRYLGTMNSELMIRDLTLMMGQAEIGVIRPNGVEPCAQTLLDLGIVVEVERCNDNIRKGEIIEISFSPKRSWVPVIIRCDVGYALGVLHTNELEFRNSRIDDVVLTRSSTLVRDPSELPCTPDKAQQR